MDKTIRINLLSGPRNISTALMYSFAQRRDTTVVDEPLYAHYLDKSDADDYHPGAEEILGIMEKDGQKVVEKLLAPYPSPVALFKQMTHHLIDIDWSFMLEMTNVILTRNPVEMLPSFAKQIPNPQLRDVGYAQHIEVLEYLQKNEKKVVVLDGREVLLNPQKVLTIACQEIGIPFDEAMLRWEAGARPEDGCWAKYWYENVHRSTKFSTYEAKTAPFPNYLRPLLEKCQPLYEQLHQLAIKA